MSKMLFKRTEIDELQVGSYELFSKTICDTDVMIFAGISGDTSPLFLKEEFAKRTEYGRRLAHPMLVASLLGGAMNRFLHPAVYTKMRTFREIAPVYSGDTITARLEIKNIDQDNRIVTLLGQCYNQNDDLVLEGECEERLLDIESDISTV